jgi:pyridoxine 4-dehydrogenase
MPDSFDADRNPARNSGCVDSAFGGRTMRFMSDKFRGLSENEMDGSFTRRTFLGMTIAGGAALVAGGSGSILKAATSTELGAAANPSFRLGGDLMVNRLGFGAMRVTGPGIWGWPADRSNALKVLRRAVDLGVDLIDTADAYGPDTSELLIAEALHPYPKGLVIATKGGLTRPGPGQWVPDGHPERLKRCVEGSLKRLKLDRIDLYQLHRIDPSVPAEDSLGALKEMQDAGKIRHIGLSEVSPEQIEQAKKVVAIVSAQNRYNMFDRKWENTLDYCEKNGLGFMPWSPIGGNRGLKSSNAVEAAAKAHGISMIQLALAWLLHRSPVMLPIPGTSSLPHLEENVAAANVKLSPSDWKQIDARVSA